VPTGQRESEDGGQREEATLLAAMPRAPRSATLPLGGNRRERTWLMSERVPERLPASAERWEPLRELEQATERMRRILDETFGWPWLGERAAWSPLVDIEETDDAYVIEAELPSVKREDVNIELAGNDLQITGEVKEQEQVRGGMARRASLLCADCLSFPSPAAPAEAAGSDAVRPLVVTQARRDHQGPHGRAREASPPGSARDGSSGR
jgi:HSP20 family molecular chaperone IbpA